MNDPLMYWNFSGTAQAFPSDGKGGQSVLRVNGTSTGAATVYTTTTVSDPTPWAPVSVVRGDYVFNSEGFYGIVQSVALPVVTVDRWRFPGVRDGQRPTDGTQASIFARNINGNASVTGVQLSSLRVTTPATGTLALTDQKGTALITFPTTIAVPLVYSWMPGEMSFPHPIGLKSSVAQTGVLEFVGNS